MRRTTRSLSFSRRKVLDKGLGAPQNVHTLQKCLIVPKVLVVVGIVITQIRSHDIDQFSSLPVATKARRLRPQTIRLGLEEMLFLWFVGQYRLDSLSSMEKARCLFLLLFRRLDSLPAALNDGYQVD